MNRRVWEVIFENFEICDLCSRVASSAARMFLTNRDVL